LTWLVDAVLVVHVMVAAEALRLDACTLLTTGGGGGVVKL
jgi:hypothetical protein